jgi:regulator of cell morphogenesis and NO signaling
MRINLQTLTAPAPTIGQKVAANPSRAQVFERWGLDYCCGGKRSLREACHERGLDPIALQRELDADDSRSTGSDGADWTVRPLGELVDHIITTHHGYLREALPRITGLIAKVVQAHGAAQPKLYEVEAVFTALRQELERHTWDEERLLFPLVKPLATLTDPDNRLKKSVADAIETLEREHDHAGSELGKLRTLTNDYSPPGTACNTYRAMLHALAELEADMHRHVHKENSILFPRATEIARQRAA